MHLAMMPCSISLDGSGFVRNPGGFHSGEWSITAIPSEHLSPTPTQSHCSRLSLRYLSPFLGHDFQYFGLWGLICVIGQMLVGLLILREFTSSYMISVLGASLLVFSPPMIFRSFIHDPLLAHWIILTGIWFVILEYRNKLWQGSWLILFGVSLLIHLYFVPMLIPLWMISLYFKYKRAGRSWKVILDFISVIGLLVLIGLSIGLFSISTENLGQMVTGISPGISTDFSIH